MDRFLTSRRAVVVAGAAATLLALAGCNRGGDSSTPSATVSGFHAVDITGADYAGKLELPDTEGKLRKLSEFKGKVTVVFFGYTHCPDVCPGTLAELAEVKRALGADGERVQGVFVTLDPERDTAELLRAYVGNFGAGFVALRPEPEQLKAVAREFKVFYMKVPGKTEGAYTLDHTAGSYIYDTQGRVRLFSRYGGGAQALADDIKKLLAQSAPA
ncbi:SCO family protein [Azohydromonas caseinilytica]|uniref:SCO family protein n=1 Tax=Azohydromonas caseinilytica TaxID=2728836 RepID=A0A848F7H9_9BURK|nr:SCO family protein [Azohydromonas caseinilytica]NML15118.1 SCO family protein [Azohydromonas caseinilytica]